MCKPGHKAQEIAELAAKLQHCSTRRCHRTQTWLHATAGQRPCCCPVADAGSMAALSAPGVEPAPAATIEVPSQPGEVAAYSDFRGSIYRFPARACMRPLPDCSMRASAAISKLMT